MNFNMYHLTYGCMVNAHLIFPDFDEYFRGDIPSWVGDLPFSKFTKKPSELKNTETEGHERSVNPRR